MAEVREHLIDTSNKLRLAFSNLIAVGEEVKALTVDVGHLRLSEAAARVSQGARTASAVASQLSRAAKAAEAAASKAEAAARAVEKAKAEAAAAAEAAAIAVQKAARAAEAAAALEVKIEPSAPVDHRYISDACLDRVGVFDDFPHILLRAHQQPQHAVYRFVTSARSFVPFIAATNRWYAKLPTSRMLLACVDASCLCVSKCRSLPSGGGDINEDQGQGRNAISGTGLMRILNGPCSRSGGGVNDARDDVTLPYLPDTANVRWHIMPLPGGLRIAERPLASSVPL